MTSSDTESRRDDRNGTGLCEEAQADGVPCYEAGRQCETCARARPEPETAKPPRPPRKPSGRKS